MRSARFFLACAVVSVLAACGTDPVAPAVEAPRFDTTPIEGTPPEGPSTSTATSECSGTVTTVTYADGTIGIQCVVETTRQHGSGG